MTVADLKPGDVLLYGPKGFYGWLISFKTWHKVAHVECYVGSVFSVASRDGQGVGMYSLRTERLIAVCRPRSPINMVDALAWYRTKRGTPYGWADLLQFAGLNVDGGGIVCSPFVTLFLRAGGLDPFNGEDANKIAPFQFELSPVFQLYEVDADGHITPRAVSVGVGTP